jgi:hypothetical protein
MGMPRLRWLEDIESDLSEQMGDKSQIMKNRHLSQRKPRFLEGITAKE